MRKNKVLSLLLAIALVTVLIAGCTSNNNSTPPASGGGTTTTPPLASGGGGGGTTPPPAADNKVYKFNVSFAAPEFSTTEITASLDRIQEKSNGRIEFTYYYSWSLTNVMTCVDDINAGVVDICAVPINEHLNLFPYSTLVTYTPFLGLPGQLETAVIYDELYAEFPVFADEFAKNGLVYWTNYPCPSYDLYTTKDFKVRKPSDLNGLKIITSSRMMQEFIQKNGGAPVSTPVTEYATSLNTNVVDGVINHINVLRAFGCLDFINAATIFGKSGTAMALLMMCFSEKSWNQLPADLQQLFIDEKVPLRDGQGAWDYGAAQGNLGAIKGAGAAVTELSAQEIAVWSDAFADILGDYIKSLESGGAKDARKVYDALQKKIAAF